MTDRLTAARAMRHAGHVGSAISATLGLSREEARAICDSIRLGWTEEGFFKTRAREHVAPAPAEKSPAAAPRAVANAGGDHVIRARKTEPLNSGPARDFSTDLRAPASEGARTFAPSRKWRPTDLTFRRPPPPVAQIGRAAEETAIAEAIAGGKLTRYSPGSEDPLPLRAARALRDRGFDIENSGHGEFRINGVWHTTAFLLKVAAREVPEIVSPEALQERGRP